MSTQIEYNFSGRRTVVTGGSSGIGLDIVQQLLRSGAQVSIWDLKQPSSEITAAGALYQAVNVCDASTVEQACAATVAELGGMDMLVNSAGHAGSTLPLEDTDPAEWQRVVDINLLGVYRTCRAAVPELKRSPAGRIVNIASLAGKEGTPNASAYSAAKAGVLALTKSLGKELAQTSVRVNAIAPAAISTELLRQMSPEHVQTMINKSPMKRLGECEEVSNLVLWLLSDACSFSTGAVFDLSGGRATY